MIIQFKPFLIGTILALSGPLIGKAWPAEPIKHIVPAQQTTITKTELFWMYSMKTRFWPTGEKITVIYQNFESSAHKEFCITVLGITTDRFQRVVETYINTGNAAYFIEAKNEKGVIYQVSKTVGAIGYISTEFVLVNNGGKIEKVRIIN